MRGAFFGGLLWDGATNGTGIVVRGRGEKSGKRESPSFASGAVSALGVGEKNCSGGVGHRRGISIPRTP